MWYNVKHIRDYVYAINSSKIWYISHYSQTRERFYKTCVQFGVLLDNTEPYSKPPPYNRYPDGCCAAKCGDLETYIWLYTNRQNISEYHGLGITHYDVYYLRYPMIAAAENGHLSIVKWIHAKGWSIDEAMYSAAENGHAHIVKWIVSTENPDYNVDKALHKAICGGSLEAVQLLHEICCKLGGATGVDVCCGITAGIYYAAMHGHLPVMEWLYTHCKRKCQPAVVDRVAQNGQLQAMLWLETHCSVGYTIVGLDWAAKNGHLECVKWIHPRLQPTEYDLSRAMSLAAGGGHLLLLEWLHSTGVYKCTTLAMDLAAGNGHLACVKWLHTHRTEGCTTSAMNWAARNGDLTCVKWLHDNRTEGCTTLAMDYAAEGGHLSCVKWLHENRTEGCTTGAMNGAAENCHLHVLEWLHENRTEGCTRDVLETTSMFSWQDHIREWLLTHRAADLA